MNPATEIPLEEEDEEYRVKLGEVVADRYEIVGRLGVGGFGEVYEAIHKELEQRVALKLLYESRPEAKRRFRREAMITAKLKHPNICATSDYGESDHGLFLAMELLRGRTLSDQIEQNRKTGDLIDWATVRDIGVAVAKALCVAHENGVVHRDIKPGNIFLVGSGAPSVANVRVLDFGIAKINDPDAKMTRTGSYLGTPSYMAPEQLLTKGTASEASDIYALGATLHAAITNHDPYEGGLAQVIAQLVQDATPPAFKSRGEIPSGLRTVIMRAMSREPEERFASATEMAKALERLNFVPPSPLARSGSTHMGADPFGSQGKGPDATIMDDQTVMEPRGAAHVPDNASSAGAPDPSVMDDQTLVQTPLATPDLARPSTPDTDPTATIRTTPLTHAMAEGAAPNFDDAPTAFHSAAGSSPTTPRDSLDSIPGFATDKRLPLIAIGVLCVTLFLCAASGIYWALSPNEAGSAGTNPPPVPIVTTTGMGASALPSDPTDTDNLGDEASASPTDPSGENVGMDIAVAVTPAMHEPDEVFELDDVPSPASVMSNASPTMDAVTSNEPTMRRAPRPMRVATSYNIRSAKIANRASPSAQRSFRRVLGKLSACADTTNRNIIAIGFEVRRGGRIGVKSAGANKACFVRALRGLRIPNVRAGSAGSLTLRRR